MPTINWPALKKTFLQVLGTTVVIAAALSWNFGEWPAALAAVAAALYLLLGFWLTEKLTGLFTRTEQASPTASIFLMGGKLAWWGALLPLSRVVSGRFEMPVAFGMGAFLLALIAAVLAHYALPQGGAPHEGKP